MNGTIMDESRAVKNDIVDVTNDFEIVKSAERRRTERQAEKREGRRLRPESRRITSMMDMMYVMNVIVPFECWKGITAIFGDNIKNDQRPCNVCKAIGNDDDNAVRAMGRNRPKTMMNK